MRIAKNIETGQFGEVFHVVDGGKEYRVRLDNGSHSTWYEHECVVFEAHEPNQQREEKSSFEKIAEEIGKTVTEKNKAYGNSFADAKQFMKILYPNGVPVESYGDMLCIVRIFDKLKRIATKKDAFGENPFRDLAGYAILGVNNELLEQTEKDDNEED